MGERITLGAGGVLAVPDEPVIPYIEGDGTGVDIWPASQRVFDAAAARHGRRIAWKQLLAGQRAFDETGTWLPDETVDALRDHLIAIKGPLTTPLGEGVRSLDVALRQALDLSLGLRPVRWLRGVPSPVRDPDRVDVVVVRATTEGASAGLEVEADSPEADRLGAFLRDELGWDVRPHSAMGVTPVSRAGCERLVRSAVEYAVAHRRRRVTLVHEGAVQPSTEGAFRRWGSDLVRQELSDVAVGAEDGDEPRGDRLLVDEAPAGATLQQLLTRPETFDVIAALDLTGDHLSAALAAQVGGSGIAPAANCNDVSGHGVFEPAHGTAAGDDGQDTVNPGSLILSGVLMFERLGWTEVAADIVRGLEATIADKVVTCDLARRIDGATEVSCPEFAAAVVDRL